MGLYDEWGKWVVGRTGPYYCQITFFPPRCVVGKRMLVASVRLAQRPELSWNDEINRLMAALSTTLGKV